MHTLRDWALYSMGGGGGDEAYDQLTWCRRDGATPVRNATAWCLFFRFPLGFFSWLAESRLFNTLFLFFVVCFFSFLLFLSHTIGSIFTAVSWLKGVPANQRPNIKSVPLSSWKPCQSKGKAGSLTLHFHCTFFIKRKQKKKDHRRGEEQCKEKVIWNLAACSTPCSLLIGLTTEIRSDFVFPFPSVTTVSQCLCLLFSWSFSLFLCACVILRTPPSPALNPPSFFRLVLLTDTGPFPGCLLCVLVNYRGDIFYNYLKK